MSSKTSRSVHIRQMTFRQQSLSVACALFPAGFSTATIPPARPTHRITAPINPSALLRRLAYRESLRNLMTCFEAEVMASMGLGFHGHLVSRPEIG